MLRKPAHLSFVQAIDGVLLLGVFAVGPVLLLGWMLALALYFIGYQLPTSLLAILVVSLFSTLGNFAAFFEVATATRLDGSRNRVRLLPFLFFGFLVSLMAVSQETLLQFVGRGFGRKKLVWNKTERYRTAAVSGNAEAPVIVPRDIAISGQEIP
jgi:hypothetical protein